MGWVNYLHVLAAMVWVGGGVALTVVGLRARSSPSPDAIPEFGKTLPYVGLRVLMPAVVLVLVTGVFMVLTSAAWHINQFWVLLALGLFAVAFLIGGVYLSRVGIQLERTAPGSGESDLRRLLDRWLAGYGVVLIVLLVALWDMIFKPGL